MCAIPPMHTHMTASALLYMTLHSIIVQSVCDDQVTISLFLSFPILLPLIFASLLLPANVTAHSFIHHFYTLSLQYHKSRISISLQGKSSNSRLLFIIIIFITAL